MTNSNTFDSFSVGDPVNWSAGTDVQPGTVVRITKTRVIVRSIETKLLNGCESGEPDALRFESGGFVGHTSGEQRYEFGEMTGPEIVFSRRENGTGTAIAKLQGTSMRGSMRAWGVLSHGHRKHYDYNF